MRVGGVYLSASCIREVPFLRCDDLAAVFLSSHLKVWCLSRWPPDQRRPTFIAALDFALEYLHKITGTVFDV